MSPEPMAALGTALTSSEIARGLGVEIRTAQRYIAEGCPTTSLAEVRAWRAANKDEMKRPTIGTRGPRYSSHELDEAEQRAKIAKLEEEARGRRIKNDKEMGSLVYRDDVEQSATELTLRIKQRLEAIPIELEPEIPIDLRAQLTARWSEKIALILTEMSQMQLTSQERSVASDYENEADDV